MPNSFFHENESVETPMPFREFQHLVTHLKTKKNNNAFVLALSLAFVTHDDPGKLHTIAIFNESKIDVGLIRQFSEMFYDVHIVLVTNTSQSVTSFARNEFESNGHEIHNLFHFSFDLEQYIPPHRLLTSTEINSLCEKHLINDRKMLPTILKSDPAVRYYNFPLHGIVEITRTNSNGGQELFYRRVVSNK